MHMWLTLAIIAVTIILFAGEWIALELVALGVIAAFLILFQFAPLPDIDGNNLLGADVLLSGFSNTALITVLALLVMGQGLHQSGALDAMMQVISTSRRSRAPAIILACLIGAGVLSAFLNNTPVVVILIPVIAALANRYGAGAAKHLMPLSYITILGGMTTLVGSSTNLLVAGLVESDGVMKIGFFDLFVPGIVLATVGTLYVLLIVPFLLRTNGNGDHPGRKHRSGIQFLARIELHSKHPLLGEQSKVGVFPSLRDVTVRLVKRQGRIILPPFEDISLQPGDIVQFAGTREQVTRLVDIDQTGAHVQLAEAAIAPASSLGGRVIVDEEFHDRTGCSIVGIQRQKHMRRDLRNKIRLQPGDVFLIAGTKSKIRELRLDRDLLVLDGSVSTLRQFTKANLAMAIFAFVIGAAAFGLVPIVISAIMGALLMLFTGCMNIAQAGRALDRRIILLVGASIAMAHAMDKTGGATFIANSLVSQMEPFGVMATLSALFLIVAILTNLLSNNATALLFTPIAISMAAALDAPAVAFIHAIIFAANCSFATPMGYQTNLLVMGPGNYKFADFFRAGAPLVVVIWITFTLIAPFAYDL